jgi:hypothetical protein
MMGLSKIIRLILLLCLFTANPLFARIFFVGSNPHLTIKAFPQDIFLIPNDFVYYYTSYQSLPWWGDIDEIDNRPHETYLSTGEKLNEGGSDFKHKASATVLRNMIGFSRTYSSTFKSRYDLSYTAIPLRNKASGTSTSSISSFEYKERHSIHDIYLRSLYAIMAGTIPIGFKLGFGTKLTTQPHLKFDITESGQSYEANRLVWAWSTEQGSAIMGSGNDNALGRFHDNYALGPLFRFDAQTAVTIPRHKMGVRFRYVVGNLKQYSYPAPADGSFSENFLGEYVKSEWVKKIRTITGRAYINYTWYEREKFRFSTLALTRYTIADSTGVLSQNQSVDNGVIERAKHFVFQVNPNVNIYPWGNKRSYIDAAILCNYANMRYDYTREYGVGGGQERSYVNTTGTANPDYSWQNYSYGRRNFFEVAGDIHTVFPLYGSSSQTLAAGISLLLWTRYKWFNKYYGTNNITATDIDFDVTGVRRNYDREAWLNSVINVFYRRGNFSYRLDVGQPLIYMLYPRTEVTLDNGEYYLGKNKGMWLSQGGLRIGLFVSTSLENFMRIYRGGEI